MQHDATTLKAIELVNRGINNLRGIFREVPSYIGCLESEGAKENVHRNMNHIKNELLALFDHKIVDIDEKTEEEFRFELNDITAMLEERCGIVMDNSDVEESVEKIIAQVSGYVVELNRSLVADIGCDGLFAQADEYVAVNTQKP
jgi:hypothetical protein